MKKMLTHGTLAATLAVVVMAGAAVAAPTVSITSPANGTTVSRSQTPTLALAGAVSFDTPVADTRQFFLRRSACGGSDNPRLSVQAGGDGSGDGCGDLVPGAFREVATMAGAGVASEDYPAVDGVPLTFDGTKPVTGKIRLTSFLGVGHAGTITVDVVLSSSAGTIGSASATETIDPLTPEQDVEFTIPANAGLDKRDLTDLSLNVITRGLNALYGFVILNGASFLNVPIYTASFDRKVQVAVDSGAFSSTGITVAGDLASWSGAIATPSAGFTHTIKARAVQGSVVSAPTEVAVTVTS
jgi:hypothetical protein